MTQPNSAAEQAAAGPQFNLQRIYLKDVSLEIPDAPAVFIDQAEPRLEFQIDTQEKNPSGRTF